MRGMLIGEIQVGEDYVFNGQQWRAVGIDRIKESYGPRHYRMVHLKKVVLADHGDARGELSQSSNDERWVSARDIRGTWKSHLAQKAEREAIEKPQREGIALIQAATKGLQLDQATVTTRENYRHRNQEGATPFWLTLTVPAEDVQKLAEVLKDAKWARDMNSQPVVISPPIHHQVEEDEGY